MNVDDLLNLDRELTDEEFAFLEQETLKAARELSAAVDALLPELAQHDPTMADRLEVESNMMLLNVEAAAAIPPIRADPAP